MYIDASSQQPSGNNRPAARLVSPQITTTSPQCLTFYYNLHGNHIGALNIYVMMGTSLNVSDTPVWTKSFNLGNRWVPGMTTVQAPSAYKVGFLSCWSECSESSSLVLETNLPRQLCTSYSSVTVR